MKLEDFEKIIEFFNLLANLKQFGYLTKIYNEPNVLKKWQKYLTAKNQVVKGEELEKNALILCCALYDEELNGFSYFSKYFLSDINYLEKRRKALEASLELCKHFNFDVEKLFDFGLDCFDIIEEKDCIVLIKEDSHNV